MARGHRAILWLGSCSSVTRQIQHSGGHILFPFCSICCIDRPFVMWTGICSHGLWCIRVCEKMHGMEAAAVARHALKGCSLEADPRGVTSSGQCPEAWQGPSPRVHQWLLVWIERMRHSVLAEKELLSPRLWTSSNYLSNRFGNLGVWQLATSQLFQLELDNSHNYPNRSAHIMPKISIIPHQNLLKWLGRGYFIFTSVFMWERIIFSLIIHLFLALESFHLLI